MYMCMCMCICDIYTYVLFHTLCNGDDAKPAASLGSCDSNQYNHQTSTTLEPWYLNNQKLIRMFKIYWDKLQKLVGSAPNNTNKYNHQTSTTLEFWYLNIICLNLITVDRNVWRIIDMRNQKMRNLQPTTQTDTVTKPQPRLNCNGRDNNQLNFCQN